VTVQSLIATAQHAGIIMAVDGDRLRLKAPVGALTSELRAELTSQKATVMEVLVKLQGMQANAGKVPIPCAVLAAVGGPGRCFSCGASLEHLDAYGRCTPCDVAADLFYAESPTTDNQRTA
jgi:hypothetical protein